MNKNKRPTIATVAQQAQLSMATVDRVLNARAPVNTQTAERVFQAAEAVGYYAARLIAERIREKKPGYHFGILLLGTSLEFYGHLREAIREQARLFTEANIICHDDAIIDRSPHAVARQIEQLAEQCDCLALVCFEHPVIHQAIERVRSRGIQIVSLLSDLSSESHRPYVGTDNVEVGRTAGWLIAHTCHPPQGSVAVILGGHRFVGHEKREQGLRSYFEEKAPGFRLLEPIINMDNADVTEEATLELLARHRDLRGLYIAGGGVEGVLSALALTPERPPLCVIVQESTQASRHALRQGLIRLVIDSQPTVLAKELIALMVKLQTAETFDPVQQRIFVPLQVLTPENI